MTNIRRENKLYSYEDQLAEIELRKELEKRKKAKGINVEPKLTKQQLEAKQAQLEKEAAIRNQTKEVTFVCVSRSSKVTADHTCQYNSKG